MTAILNHPDFPISVLEGYILYLFGKSVRLGDGSSKITEYIGLLKPDRWKQLFIESRFLSHDFEFIYQALLRLENREIDELLAKRPDFCDRMMALVEKLDEEILTKLVLNNPVVLSYTLLFLELDGRMDEAAWLEKQYAPLQEEARSVAGILRILKSINRLPEEILVKNRGKIGSYLASLVLQRKSPGTDLIFGWSECGSRRWRPGWMQV